MSLILQFVRVSFFGQSFSLISCGCYIVSFGVAQKERGEGKGSKIFGVQQVSQISLFENVILLHI